MELKRKPVTLLVILLYFTHTSKQLNITTLDAYLKTSSPEILGKTLNHFTVSECETSIYLGAVGSLYHLSRQFDVLSNVSTGVNNTNKILSLAPEPVNRLISCGSGLNGTCQLRFLYNLTDSEQETLSKLKITEDGNTTLGLVVNQTQETPGSLALYIAKNLGKGEKQAPIEARCLSKLNGNICNKATNPFASGVTSNFFLRFAALFSYDGYTYVFASQQLDATGKNEPNFIVPKLSRVCQTDSSSTMDGFSEISLKCEGTNNTIYNIVQSAVVVDDQLFAVFVKNNGGTDFDPTNQSALCVYDMKNLMQEFDTTTTSCTCGEEGTYSSSNYLSGAFCSPNPALCENDAVAGLPCEVPNDFSRYPERSADLGLLSGGIVFEYPQETFTSILITETIVQNTTQKMAFIGTQEGHLLKVQFNEIQSPGFLYEKVDVQDPVLSDTWIGTDSIMVLTERKLLELSVANCSRHQTCEECLNGDPYCGWCTLEEKCTMRTECSDSDDGDRWLPFYETTCLDISAEPESLSVTLAGDEHIIINATHLPVGVDYSCHFGNFTTPAHRLSESLNFLECGSPGLTYLPDFSEGDVAVSVNLSLSSSGASGTFISIPYFFFNCSKISGCKDCTFKWDCEWCATDFTCNFNESSYGDSYITTDDDCPMVKGEEFYIPNNVFRNITVTVETPSEYSAVSNKSYECVVTYLGKSETSLAQLSDNSTDQFSLTCNAAKYNYAANVQDVPAELRIRWKENGVYLDGTGSVTLYKCEVDRPDCSRCLSNITTPPMLNCGWCLSQSECTVSENCGQTIQQECTNPPKITAISPTSGPTEGGTMVQINGTDLGQRFSDIDNVILGNTTCNHQEYEEEYEVGESITCVAGRVEGVGDVKVSVVIMDSTAVGDLTFSYRSPEFSSFDPKKGPASGGTLITISGTDLDTGRNIEAFLGDQDCQIRSMNSSCVQCTNTNSSVDSNHTLTLSFDGYNVSSRDGKMFVYKKDPEILSVDPTTFIKAGGNLLTVSGERLDVIKMPKIVFTVDEESSQENCIHKDEDGNEMTCKSPAIRLTGARRRRATQDGGKVEVGFIMDGVSSLVNWSMNADEEIMYVPNPDYKRFTIMNFRPESNILTLEGTNLSAGSQEIDVEVYIGTEECEVISLNEDSVLCTPPKDQPAAGDRYGNDTQGDLPVVTVQHANLYFRLGPVRYVNQLFLILQIAIPIFVFLVIILFCIMVWMWYIRKKKGDKIKDLEIQMREIQDSVSGNLKSLFATLQTTMHDFDSALEQRQIIPLHSKRQYILNMLFLGLQVEPPSQPSEEVIDNEKLKFAMQEFSTKLLSKKNFLEVLVRTIDGCTNIGAMDRVNIASLLSVCLLQDGKQELLSSVLISLMREQIEDCDGKRNKCRILFSRNETVLEKLLSNWVTLFLYKYFKDDAATQFYQLYHAIKYVCEIGPIDAVTGKSQFSINDQWMLESQVDFNDLNLEVISNSVTGEKISVGVLDVNTISQVKDRIISQLYKDSAFSSQPSPHDYDLMWRVGMGGQLILRDEEDLAGNTENGWRKLNTLADFNVNSEHACFELVERQQNPNAAIIDPSASAKLGDYNASSSEANGKSGFKGRNEALGRSVKAPWVPQGCKVWHLVKDEDQNEEQEEKATKPKEIKEVVLPFLPATRNYIQKYVDAALNVMFADQNQNIPKAIRYLFQFFDREAGKLGEEDFAKAWKDNVLALRYWTTIIANPQYPLDIGMESYTQACLRILVQVVKDTCAGRNKPNRSQDFSPSRLLYSSFLPGYINKLGNYYSHVQSLGRVDSEDLTLECNLLQENFADTFDLTSTQYELFKFLQTYGDVLQKGLEEDDVCDEDDMVGKFQSLVETVGPVPVRENFYDPVES